MYFLRSIFCSTLCTPPCYLYAAVYPQSHLFFSPWLLRWTRRTVRCAGRSAILVKVQLRSHSLISFRRSWWSARMDEFHQNKLFRKPRDNTSRRKNSEVERKDGVRRAKLKIAKSFAPLRSYVLLAITSIHESSIVHSTRSFARRSLERP